MGQVTGRHDWRGGDGMSMFGGRLLAAAQAFDCRCQAFDCSHGCPLCAVRQTLQVETRLLSAMSGAPTPEMGTVGQFRSVPQIGLSRDTHGYSLGVFRIDLDQRGTKQQCTRPKGRYGESSPDVLISIRRPCVRLGHQSRRGLAVAILVPTCVLTGCCQPRARG